MPLILGFGIGKNGRDTGIGGNNRIAITSNKISYLVQTNPVV